MWKVAMRNISLCSKFGNDNWWIIETRNMNFVEIIYKHDHKLQVFHTVHLSSIILRITNRCHFFFVIFLYYMSLPYMFRASIGPSSGVFPAVATCCHLVHVVLGVCPSASEDPDARGHTPSTTWTKWQQVATAGNTPDDGPIEARNM